MIGGALFSFGVVIILAAVLSFVAQKFRQPLIVAYIATGAIAGPLVISAFSGTEDVFQVLAQSGVAFLLFTVGLGLDWRSVKNVGGVALAAGLASVVVTGAVAWIAGAALGVPPSALPYLAAALGFSSTIVVVKLLSDTDEQDTLHGRVSVGILLVQDVIAMFLLLTLVSVGNGTAVTDALTQALLKGIALLPVLWFISAKIVPRIVAYAATSQELLLMFAIAWCFFIGGVLSWLGFGVEIGALIAGVTLSGTAFEAEIEGRVRPLRDFFLVAFFILLGTHFDISVIPQTFGMILLFSAIVFVLKPLAVMLVLRSLGHHPRTGFLTGTTLGQVSEFSFIVLSVGVVAGAVPDALVSTATAVALVTIAASSYAITHNESAYQRFSPFLRWLEPSRVLPVERSQAEAHHTVVFGAQGLGSEVLESVRRLGGRYMIVDVNPDVVRELSEAGEPVMYGDAGDEVVLMSVRAEKARFLISTIPDVSVSLQILSFLRSKRFSGICIVSARTNKEAQSCYAAGASFVIVPTVLGGRKFRELFEKSGGSRVAWKRTARVHSRG